MTDAQTNPKQSSILATVMNVIEANEIIVMCDKFFGSALGTSSSSASLINYKIASCSKPKMYPVGSCSRSQVTVD